jgi:hypothetical protein
VERLGWAEHLEAGRAADEHLQAPHRAAAAVPAVPFPERLVGGPVAALVVGGRQAGERPAAEHRRMPENHRARYPVDQVPRPIYGRINTATIKIRLYSFVPRWFAQVRGQAF